MKLNVMSTLFTISCKHYVSYLNTKLQTSKLKRSTDSMLSLKESKLSMSQITESKNT
jgi:hypothetical protein